MDGNESEGEGILAAVFEAGGSLVAIDASRVEEIVRVPRITAVRGAKAHVLGIANLRGRIITVLDASRLLGFGPAALGEGARVLVVDREGESVGVAVERLRDVVEVRADGLRLASREGASPRDERFLGVFESEGRTVALLDPDKATEAE